MKLAATLFCAALLGCVDEGSSGGGQLGGLGAEKSNGLEDHITSIAPDYLEESELTKSGMGIHDRTGTQGLGGITTGKGTVSPAGCLDCEATARTFDRFEEVTWASAGVEICRIVKEDDAVIFDSCN